MQWFKLWPMLFIGGLSLAVVEFFPLSSFAMYSHFSEETYVVYVADAEGEPLAAVKELKVLSSVMRKSYHRKLKDLKKELDVKRIVDLTVEQRGKAGAAILKEVREHHAVELAKKHDVLRLVEVRIRLGDSGGIEKTEYVIAESRL